MASIQTAPPSFQVGIPWQTAGCYVLYDSKQEQVHQQLTGVGLYSQLAEHCRTSAGRLGHTLVEIDLRMVSAADRYTWLHALCGGAPTGPVMLPMLIVNITGMQKVMQGARAIVSTPLEGVAGVTMDSSGGLQSNTGGSYANVGQISSNGVVRFGAPAVEAASSEAEAAQRRQMVRDQIKQGLATRGVPGSREIALER